MHVDVWEDQYIYLVVAWDRVTLKGQFGVNVAQNLLGWLISH